MSNARARLRAIRIRSIRGIVKAELTPGPRGMVVQGANGHGKSSIADALELLFTGAISHLEGRQNLSTGKHGKHVLANDGESFVEADLTNGGTLRRSLTGPLEVNPIAVPYARDAARATFQLRRAQLLKFIHEDPAERFRTLASLMGISRLDAVELAVKRAGDALKGELDADRAKVAALTGELKTISGVEFAQFSEQTALQFVNRTLEGISRPKVKSLNEAAEIAAALVDSAAIDVRAQRLAQAQARLGELRSLRGQTAFFDNAQQVARQIEAFQGREEAKRVDALAAILEAGARYVSEYQPDHCPLCESQIDRSALGVRLTARLAAVQELTEEAAGIRTAAAAAAREASDFSKSLRRALAAPEGALAEDLVTAFGQIQSGALQVTAVLGGAGVLGAVNPAATITATAEHASTVLTAAVTEIEARIATLSPTANETATAKAMANILRLQYLLSELVVGNERIQSGGKRLGWARQALEALVTAKNEVVLEIYAAIKADVDSYYALLHPDEPHGNITLDVSKRASTNLWMDSFGVEQQDPRAFSSEGHLDSLGLCIFLAFANTFRSECNLMVLDDVVMSIDEGHRRRVAELLIKRFEDFQLVITTHDRVWFKELTASQRVAGVGGAFDNKRILDWHKEDGPRFDDYRPLWDGVTAALQRGEVASAGGDTRRNFEWVLQEMAEALFAEVPFQREPRYTADTLYQPVRKRLQKLLPDESKSVIAGIEACVLFGNMTAHSTRETDLVAPAEIEEFSRAVQALFAVSCCAACGAMLNYDQQGKSLFCRNAKCTAKTIKAVK